MKYTKIFLLFLLIFSQYFSLFADYKIDKKIFNIINGVYEVESWFDGKNYIGIQWFLVDGHFTKDK